MIYFGKIPNIFINPDHLNYIGAEILTKKIDKIINSKPLNSH
jgi:hypothetical protein